MYAKVSDIRVIQAQRHGIIVGLPRELAEQIARVADYLLASTTWGDIKFLFSELQRDGEQWSIPLNSDWSIAFRWTDGLAAFDIHL
jgi:plasmid maintenance system killer protein